MIQIAPDLIILGELINSGLIKKVETKKKPLFYLMKDILKIMPDVSIYISEKEPA